MKPTGMTESLPNKEVGIRGNAGAEDCAHVRTRVLVCENDPVMGALCSI
jgi:hypothetical protein